MASARLAMGVRCIASARPAVARSTGCYLRPFIVTRQPKSCRFMGMTATAQAVDPAYQRHPKKDSQNVEEAVEFSTLKGKIEYDTLKAITHRPFNLKTMTSVQQAVLSLLPELVRPYDGEESSGAALPCRDLLVRARTGTGKTLAFLVPAVEARLKCIQAAGKKGVLDAGKTSDKHMEGRIRRVFTRTNVGALIISPTRELATQIANEALRLAHHHDDFEVRLFTGGTSKLQQVRDFMRGRRDIVVATPGRLLDVLASEPDIRDGIARTEMLILDEADTLLDMGFRDDIDAIIKYLPPSPRRQTFMFSATVSKAIRQIATRALAPNHNFVDTVGDDDVPVHQKVPQYHTVLSSPVEQIPHIMRLIAQDQLTHPRKSKVIFFLPTTRMTQLFATLLRHLSKTVLPALNRTAVYEIHSKLTQNARIAASDSFRKSKGCSILITSDVSARGVDYPGVTRVVQLGIPGGTDQYVHRIGRTGRGNSAVGRGDLVLLPWEIGFLTWRLQDIPLKPLTTGELITELESLAERYDEDPEGVFWGGQKPDSSQSFDPAKVVKPFPGKMREVLSRIGPAIEDILPKLDGVAIRETFASLLGYYIAKSGELRVQRSVILEGCRDWTTGACGLSQPPFVSEAFLGRIGFHDNRTKHFAKSYDRAPVRTRSVNAPIWMGRGSVRNRREGVQPKTPTDWLSRELDPNDPAGNPEEFITAPYGKRVRRIQPPRQSFGGIDDGPGMGGFGFESTGTRQRAPRERGDSWRRDRFNDDGDKAKRFSGRMRRSSSPSENIPTEY